MDQKLSSDAKVKIREIEQSLIQNDLPSEEIKETLATYLKDGDKVTPAPEEYMDSIKIIQVKNQPQLTWHVDFDLWVNNIRSNLTLLVLLSDDNGKIKAEIQDLHML